MKGNKNKMLLRGLAVALAVTLITSGGTFAYLQSSTGDTVNTFNTNKINVELTETTGESYNIKPGTEQPKDPKVKVDNTVDAYVYVEVTDGTEGLVGYEIAEGWQLLAGTNNIYWRDVAAGADVKEFSVLKGDKVTYASSLGNSDMLDADGNLKQGINLTFRAHAVQKEPFNDPVKAFPYAKARLVTDDEFNKMLENNDHVVLTENLIAEDKAGTEYNMTENAVLDIGKNTMNIPYMSGIFQGKDAIITNGNIESRADYPLFIGNGTKETSITVERVNLNGGINVYAGSAILRDVYADASSKNYYAVWADNGATITIESGTYIGAAGKPAILSSISENPDADGPSGVIIVKGGKFNTDVSQYVADGYKTVESVEGGKTWYTVVKA